MRHDMNFQEYFFAHSRINNFYHASSFYAAAVLFSIILLAAMGNVQAQSPLNPISSATVSPLPLYDAAGAAKPVRTINAQGFPWTVLEDKQDFYRVHVEGNDYWVDSMNVRTAPSVKAKCTLVSADRKQPVGATMGAGENPCAPK